MRILLINSNRFKQPWPVMPYGLLCVAAACDKAGFETRLLDLCFSNDCENDIRAAVADFNPEVIGISIRNIDNGTGYNTMFLLDETKKAVIDPCKKVFHGPIIIGGPSVGISGKEMLEYFDLEYAVRGDGEACIIEFLKRFEAKAPLTGLEGLIIRKDDKVIQYPDPLRVKDMNELPYADPKKYLDLSMYQKFDSPLQIQTKRGCALRCSYCTYNKIEGSVLRPRDPQSVADEIERLVKETGITHVEFTDSVFNIPLNHAKDVLKAIIKKDLPSLRLRTLGLNPAAVDEELAELMLKSGLCDVDLGVETACNETLKSLGKNYTKEDVLRAGKLLRDRKISVNWYLLVGAPAETLDTLNETIDTVAASAAEWDLINFGIGIRVYNGAPLADQLRQENPALAKDNFLYPVNYEPSRISLDLVKAVVKLSSFKHPNIFMYDEDETTPPFVQKVGVMLLKLFAPKEPIYKFFILQRKIEKLLGISVIKRKMYEARHQELIRKMRRAEEPIVIKSAARFYLQKIRGLVTPRDIIRFSVRRNLNKIAVVDQDRSVTYKELYGRSERLANYLTGSGLDKGDRLAVLLYNCQEYFEINVASFMTGITLVPVIHDMSMEGIEFVLNDCKAKCLIYDPEILKDKIEALKKSVKSISHFIPVANIQQEGSYESLVSKASGAEPKVDISPSDIASINFPSEAAEKPKGVMLTYTNWAGSFYNYILNAIKLPRKDLTILHVLPFAAAGGTALFAALASGAKSIVMKTFNPKEALSLISKYSVYGFFSSPGMLIQFMDHCKSNGIKPKLSRLIVGTAAMPKAKCRELIEFFGPIIERGFGIVEALPPLALSTSLDYMKNSEIYEDRLSSVGRAVRGVNIRIVDNNDTDLEPGKAGKIVIKSPTVSEGYLNSPDFLGLTHKDGSFYSNEFGYLDKDGYLYVLGREEDIVKDRNGKGPVFASQIEDVIHAYPGVMLAHAFKNGNSRIAVCVSMRKGFERTSTREIEAWYKGTITKTGLPPLGRVVILPEIPLNAAGKVDRRKVREAYLKRPTIQKFEEQVKPPEYKENPSQ